MARINASTSTALPAATSKSTPGIDPRYSHHEPNPHGKPTPAQVFAAGQQVITTTPIPKLDSASVHSAVTPLTRIPRVDVDECVGCNLCSLVCPVDDCITMDRVETNLPFESWAQRTQSTNA